MKQCIYCNTIKTFKDFHKRTKSADGLQKKCKVCTNKYNDKYRKEINPTYWNSKDGYFSDKTNWDYINDYRRADKDIKIYILRVVDYFYIGMTKARLNVRINTHRADYRNPTKHGSMPKLHSMFDKLTQEGVDDVLSKAVVLETRPGTRYDGYRLEKKWIRYYAEKGWPLLNNKHHTR